MTNDTIPTISLKDKLTPEEFKSFSELSNNPEKFNQLRNSIRKKLAAIDKKFKDYVFFAKPVYEKDEKKATVQGMVHIGPKEIYEKINEEIETSDLAFHEGIGSEDPAKGLRFADEKKQKYYKKIVNQMRHLTKKEDDVTADISKEEINRIMASKLSPTEFELWVKQEEISNVFQKSIPNLIKHIITKFLSRKIFSKKLSIVKAQGVEDFIYPAEQHEADFSKENIESTAEKTIDELKIILTEKINEHNEWIKTINQTKNTEKKQKLFEEFKTVRYLLFYRLKYQWIKKDDELSNEKLTWLDEQLGRFVDPYLNIKIAQDEVILDERNFVLGQAINNPKLTADKKNLHANYGQAHLEGIHDIMLEEDWKLKDIELKAVKYPKISLWKRTKDLIKAPFSIIKNIPKIIRTMNLAAQARQENKADA